MTDAETAPAFAVAGTVERSIEVGLSYRIVELFSEGLYQSANKAFEELVTNAFDAGAEHVQVILPSDSSKPDSTIVVVDDGGGMNSLGLEQLWQIGASQKPNIEVGPGKRYPIGKFGIGKLATYTLAQRLTYVCKKDGEYFSTSMDFGQLDAAAKKGIATQRLSLDVRKLTAQQAENALQPWLKMSRWVEWDHPLFGKSAAKSWTFAILSNLKPKAAEISQGRLKWILSTALPLREDFALSLNGTKVRSSKIKKKRLEHWVLGKDLTTLKRPAPDDLEVRLDEDVSSKDFRRFGLYSPLIGRVSGFAEIYADPLTGKSDAVGRSYGFFVYVRERLINLDDEYFGVDSNLLKHGVFSRCRVVLHVDALNDQLQSNREGVRDGPALITTRNVLHAVFNALRTSFESHQDEESPESRLARRLEGDRSLIQGPVLRLVRRVLAGEADSRFLKVPQGLEEEQQSALIEELEERVEGIEAFLTGVEYSYELAPSESVAVYDVATGSLILNGRHPFVAAFSDDFQSQKHALPLQLLAVAEIALEATLHRSSMDSGGIAAVLADRDEVLRQLSQTVPRTAAMIADALSDARNDADKLEEELVAAFNSLGFDANRIGGSGKPDGIASVPLAALDEGAPQAFQVSLEAKSKQVKGAKVSAKSVNVSGIARLRDDFRCEHAVVVGPEFSTSQGDESSLASEIAKDREKVYEEAPTRRGITLLRIDDLATLVRHAPLKRITPLEIKDLLTTCSLPDEAGEWIRKQVSREVKVNSFRPLLEEIWKEQERSPNNRVDFAVIRSRLSEKVAENVTTDEVRHLCRALFQLHPNYLSVSGNSVELRVPPQKLLQAVAAATQIH